MTTNEKPRYSMLIQWSDNDQKYLVRLPEWKGETQQFVTHGDTYEEAVNEAKFLISFILEPDSNTLQAV